LLLNAHDFLYGVSYIEQRIVLSELLGVDLGQAEHVVDTEVEELGGGVLDVATLLHV